MIQVRTPPYYQIPSEQNIHQSYTLQTIHSTMFILKTIQREHNAQYQLTHLHKVSFTLHTSPFTHTSQHIHPFHLQLRNTHFLSINPSLLPNMARSQEKAHNLMNKWITAKHRMRLGQTAYSISKRSHQ